MAPTDILCPIDGTETSFRALEFAAEMADQYDASLSVVHITDEHTDATDEIVARAESLLDSVGVEADLSVSTDIDLSFRPANHIGQTVLAMVDRTGYDHVVMGHEGSGTVERAIIGSAAETVLRAERVPVTVIP
ncbi:MAG: universal stress protein [Halodesulfurarchaeum sp.]